jgi:hypothetical protein
MASRRPITVPARVRWRLHTALIATAAMLGACMFGHSEIAGPGAYDRCVQRTDDGFGNTIVGNTVGNSGVSPDGHGNTFGNTVAGNTIGNTTGVTSGNSSGPAISGQINALISCCGIAGGQWDDDQGKCVG